MKLHLLITIFLFIIRSKSNALNCINTDKPIQISNDFTLSAVKTAINNLIVNDTSDKCYIRININYPDQFIEISFGMTFQSTRLLTNQQVLIDFRMDLAEK